MIPASSCTSLARQGRARPAWQFRWQPNSATRSLPRTGSKRTLHTAFGAPQPDRAWSRRLGARATHPVHVVTALQLEAMAEYDRPVGIGGLVTVDTTVPVDVSAVAAAVRDYHDR